MRLDCVACARPLLLAGRDPLGVRAGVLLQGDHEGRPHLRLQRRRQRRALREDRRDGHRHHQAGRRPERRDGRRRQRARPAALLLQARHLRAGAGAGRRRSRRSSGATARRASRPTTPTSRSRTACRCASPRELPTTTRSSPGTPARGDRRGVVPHPPRQVQARRLDDQALADLRDAAELSRRSPAPTSARSSRTRRSTSTSRKGKGTFRVHVGQFKPPFGAQEMTSSGSQMFVDRALVSNSFFRGRETGVALWGATPNNKFEWRVGMFNGNGLTRTVNDNDKFQYNARLMWQPNGSQVLNQRAWVTGALYSESDFESTTTPIYAVAHQLGEPEQLRRHDRQRPEVERRQRRRHLQVQGLLRRTGCIRRRSARRRPAPSSTPSGGFIQAGKLFSRRRYEVALRYGQFDPTDLTAREQRQRRSRGAFSYYYARHGLKWQSDFGQVEVQAGPTGADGEDVRDPIAAAVHLLSYAIRHVSASLDEPATIGGSAMKRALVGTAVAASRRPRSSDGAGGHRSTRRCRRISGSAACRAA